MLDTHVWIWAATDDRKRLGARTRRLLAREAAVDRVYVSSASAFEIAALHTAGRLMLNQPVERWIRESIHRAGLRVLDLRVDAAVDAGAIPATAVGDPLDRSLVALARESNLSLVTADRRILDFARQSRQLRVVNAAH